MTNKTIKITKKETDWSGDPVTTDLGDFDVYLEEEGTRDYVRIDGESVAIQGTAGFFILFSDLDLKNAEITYDDNEFVVDSWDKFFDPYGDFHHIEATFK